MNAYEHMHVQIFAHIYINTLIYLYAYTRESIAKLTLKKKNMIMYF